MFQLIAYDHGSDVIILTELKVLYEDRMLPPLTIQYLYHSMHEERGIVDENKKLRRMNATTDVDWRVEQELKRVSDRFLSHEM